MSLPKIVFILPNLNGGGAERVTLNFIKYLKDKLYDLTLILLEKTPELESSVPEGIELINLNTRSTSKSFKALKKQLRETNPNIVFTSHSRLAFLISIIGKERKKFVHIARVQGSPKAEKEYNAYSKTHRAMFGYGFRKADIVIAQTKEMKREIEQVYRVRNEKCRVIHNPVDPDIINIQPNTKGRLLPSGKFNFLASGRLHSVKGFDTLINAFSSIYSTNNDIHLTILGSDKGEKQNLEHLISSLNLSSVVTLAGHIDNPAQHYLECEAFVLSSIHEGFPNALLENYCMNTPIISTKCCGIVEQLIMNGVNGYIAEVNDIHSLSSAMKNSLKLRRKDIKNPQYVGANLNSIIEECIDL
tara:strand:+ start:94569 stop:95645 length:1077 start_codon:yes stop_codon:yes gene_type:complete